MSMPLQKPGQSKQDYGTPRELIRAIEKRWGKLECDLAASADNAKAPSFFSLEEDNSLTKHWHLHHKSAGKLCWLNPPFADIGQWTIRCKESSGKGLKIIMLVPASIGTEWFARDVYGYARILALRPRLTFEGCTAPYPKDCMLLLWGFNRHETPSFDLWKWNE